MKCEALFSLKKKVYKKFFSEKIKRKSSSTVLLGFLRVYSAAMMLMHCSISFISVVILEIKEWMTFLVISFFHKYIFLKRF